MSSINPEMLKQLLSEFEEKQAVCREEINEINNQIVELEQRIESSKERLVSVARDREKIGLMKQRYQDGDWSSVLSQVSKSSNGDGGQASKPAISKPESKRPAVEPPAPGAQTGDYPPVNVSKTEAPPPNLIPQPVIAPPAPTTAQEFLGSFGSGSSSSPEAFAKSAPQASEASPVPDFSMSSAPEAAPANLFEQAPATALPPAGQLPFSMDAPNWDPPQPYQPEAAPQPAQAPVAQTPPPANEGLFPFSGQQAQADPAGGAEIPWAPPPTMTWESVGGSNQTFPPNQAGVPDSAQFQQQQPQHPQQAAYQNPPSFPDNNQFGGMPSPFQQAPEMQPLGGFADPNQGAPTGPPPGFMSPPPIPNPPANSQAVLTTAFDDEFDISDALRGDDDQANPDARDNDKKIKDALRGLFS